MYCICSYKYTPGSSGVGKVGAAANNLYAVDGGN